MFHVELLHNLRMHMRENWASGQMCAKADYVMNACVLVLINLTHV